MHRCICPSGQKTRTGLTSFECCWNVQYREVCLKVGEILEEVLNVVGRKTSWHSIVRQVGGEIGWFCWTVGRRSVCWFVGTGAGGEEAILLEVLEVMPCGLHMCQS